jgi:hypothetical protein
MTWQTQTSRRKFVLCSIHPLVTKKRRRMQTIVQRSWSVTSLIGVLLRIRQFPVPISGEIEKMYHQVLASKQQQSLSRFLWKNPSEVGDPKEYQMTVHVFCAVSSTTSCIYALRKTSEDCGSRFPDVADSVKTSTSTIIWILQKQKEKLTQECLSIVQVWWPQHGPMALILPICPSHCRSFRSFTITRSRCWQTLNRTASWLLWNFQHDSFFFQSSIKIQAKAKREVLQDVASVFYPLGFLSHILITAKILPQDIWWSGADWDDPLPPKLLEIWAKELSAIASIMIPCCFRLQEKPISYELHVCSATFELGFGVCVYLLFYSIRIWSYKVQCWAFDYVTQRSRSLDPSQRK